MSKLSILFAIALFVCPITNSLWAQERVALPGLTSQHPPYPDRALITFQWNYSCPSHRDCSFFCPGAGGASNVIKLDIYLGKIPDETGTPALFYDFATEDASQGTGFSLNGVPISPCQVVGMTLDYSGPPNGNAPTTSKY
jgi:hypothetical protein